MAATLTRETTPLPEPPPPPGRWQPLFEVLGSGRPAALVGRYVAWIVAFLVAEHFVFHSDLPGLVDGVCLGALYGLIGVGLVLIYRTARIINFAAAAIGAIPAIVALLLDIENGVSYLAVLPIALIGGPVLGAVVDVLVIRRFSRSPRLILTVVTLGVAQTLGVLGFFIPIWMGALAGETPDVPTPFTTLQVHNGRGQPVLTGNQVFALVVVVVIAAALAAFLRYTRVGIALRASAENADRAALLGIPVRRIQTAAWAIAGLVGAMGIFVSAPLIGVPSNASLGFATLLYALSAAVIGRMERIGTTLVAGMAIGIVITASVTHYGDSSVASAIMLPVILAALLFQRKGLARALDTGVSTYQALKEHRPIPKELRHLPEVQVARRLVMAVFVALAVVLPFVVGGPNLPDLILLPIYGIVSVSLVVLTGWAGQISLGQFAIVGFAAAVAGGLVANHNIGFFAALGLGVAAGAVIAVLVGLPALRIQGLYLAVTTLAFGFAMYDYVLNVHYPIGRALLPTGFTAHLERPLLLQRIDLTDDRSFYFVCLVFLFVVMMAAFSFRRFRSGRVLIAARDNQRAAPSYSINVVRTRLAAFAVSGGIAGLAGVLLAYAENNVVPGSFNVTYSIAIFLATVIGGLTSIPWAVYGGVILETVTLFLPRIINAGVTDLFGSNVASITNSVLPLLLTGPFLIVVLMRYPNGSAEGGFAARDRFLRGVATKRGLLVPSLIADRRADAADTEGRDVVAAAEHHVEEVEGAVESSAAAASGSRDGARW
ncbi:MAG: ABC transporter permease [Acidimicrobiales bacterium]